MHSSRRPQGGAQFPENTGDQQAQTAQSRQAWETLPSERHPRGPNGVVQAARTVVRKRSTSNFSLPPSLDSSPADVRTAVEAEPVSFAPLLTSPILTATRLVPSAACWMLRAISCVSVP